MLLALNGQEEVFHDAHLLKEFGCRFNKMTQLIVGSLPLSRGKRVGKWRFSVATLGETLAKPNLRKAMPEALEEQVFA